MLFSTDHRTGAKYVGVVFGQEVEETYAIARERVLNPPTMNIVVPLPLVVPKTQLENSQFAPTFTYNDESKIKISYRREGMGWIDEFYKKGEDVTLKDGDELGLNEERYSFSHWSLYIPETKDTLIYKAGDVIQNTNKNLSFIGIWKEKERALEGQGKGILIAVDPGHGIDTPGKRTPVFQDGTVMKEREFNKAVALYLIPLLDAQGFSVIKVAESDYGDPNKPNINGVNNTDRVKLANNVTKNAFNRPADFYLSIHANASGDGSSFNDGKGIETLIYTNDKGGKTEELAKIIQKNLVQNGYNLNDRGIKYYDYEVIRDTKMPAVIVECGFMTNLEEAELLRSDAYRKACANSLAKAMIEIIPNLK